MINRDRIIRAILTNERLDYSHQLFGQSAPASNELRPFPPVLGTEFQTYPGDRATSPWEAPAGPIQGLRDFEGLSLMARQRALALPPPGYPTSNWLSSQEPMESVAAEDVIDGILAAAEFLSADLPETSGAALKNRIGGLSNRIPKSSGHSLTPHLRQRSAARRGLQLVGLRVTGPVLGLTSINLPFSLRLIGCVVDGSITADRATLVTLDLSGSVVRGGVYGTFLNASGSVRMRRTVCMGPVDFGGATIAGTFDASDAVFVPSEDPPPTEAYVSDRGVLNLALANIGNEMRMSRARIYGGVNMRGCIVQRTLFMNDVIIRSPEAFLEKLAFDAVRHSDATKALPPYLEASAQTDETMANVIHREIDAKLFDDPTALKIAQNDRRRRIELERLHLAKPLTEGLPGALMGRLLAESMRARTSALRADGARIHGSLFARGARIAGQFRMKYARVEGGLHLDGARLRAPRSIAEGFAWLSKHGGPSVDRLCELFTTTRDSSEAQEPQGSHDLALDLRDSHFSGAIDLAPERRQLAHVRKQKSLINEICVRLLENDVDGRHLVDEFRPDLDEHAKARLGGLLPSLGQRKAYHAWADKGGGHTLPKPLRDEYDKKLRGIGRRTARFVELLSGGTVRNALLVGEISITGATVGGSVDLRGLIANLYPRPEPADSSCSSDGAHKHTIQFKPQLQLTRVQIGGDLDLRGSMGLMAISAGKANIAGSVLLAARPDYDLPTERWKSISQRALHVSCAPSRVRGANPALPADPFQQHDFRGAVIGGDAVFLFGRMAGPHLSLSLSSISGRLVILPSTGPLDISASDFKKHMNCEERIRRPRSRDERRLAVAKSRDFVPCIDLRDASTVVLAHPPSAWPQQDGLIVEGFTYERAREYGPLSPRRRTWGGGRADMYANFRNLSYAAVGALHLLVPLLFLWLVQPALRDLVERWGPINVGLCVLMLGATLFHFAIRIVTRPKPRDEKPLAIRWLDLQRRRISVVRVRSTARPLQPYIQAAKVLRDSGRTNSANLVELERLRVRRRHLSYRRAYIPRLFLLITDWTTKYGFRTVRPAALTLGLVAVGGAVFYQADRCNLIWPTDPELAAMSAELARNPGSAATGGSPVWWNATADFMSPTFGKQPPAANIEAPYPRFNSLLYALDLAIPILDFSQESKWTAFATRPRWTDKSANLRYCMVQGPADWILWFALGLQILGWILTTAIAVALVSRIETVLARNEE